MTIDPTKIQHLPELKRKQQGFLNGFFNKKPVEIGEIVLREGLTLDTRIRELPQAAISQKRMVIYALGRTEEGELVVGDMVNDRTGLVEEGQVLLNIVNYTPKVSYE